MKNRTKVHLTIKSELEHLLLPLEQEEFAQLEQNLLSNGCLEPLIVWKNGNEYWLVDGHNRYKICTRHGIEFDTREVAFESLDDAKVWILDNQMGRRNINSDQLSYYRGLKYLKLKKKKGGYDNVLSKGASKATSTHLGQTFNVSASTIKRDANYAAGINLIADSNEALKNKILFGKGGFKKKDIQLLGEMNPNLTFKNEEDLSNKLALLKKSYLQKVETGLSSFFDATTEDMEVLTDSYEERVQKCKAAMLSYINIAIERKDTQAIEKLKTLIDRLQLLIKE